jgi:MFS family permease
MDGSHHGHLGPGFDGDDVRGGQPVFLCLRLLLGAAEAGFFPGVILYLTYWFPNRARAQVFGLFYFGAPLALIFGGPISGLLLQMNPVGSSARTGNGCFW